MLSQPDFDRSQVTQRPVSAPSDSDDDDSTQESYSGGEESEGEESQDEEAGSDHAEEAQEEDGESGGSVSGAYLVNIHPDNTGEAVLFGSHSGAKPVAVLADEAPEQEAPRRQQVPRSRDGNEAQPAATTSGGGASFYAATPSDVAFSAPSFEEMNLSRQLVKACANLGYQQPTPIQVSHSTVSRADCTACHHNFTQCLTVLQFSSLNYYL